MFQLSEEILVALLLQFIHKNFYLLGFIPGAYQHFVFCAGHNQIVDVYSANGDIFPVYDGILCIDSYMTSFYPIAFGISFQSFY